MREILPDSKLPAQCPGDIALQRSRTHLSAEISGPEERTCQSPGNASTEPHSFECGDQPRPCLSTTDRPRQQLQRSRTHLSAEIMARQRPHFKMPNASTEPHSFECGDSLSCCTDAVRSSHASTEPHSFECGDLRSWHLAAPPRRASTEPHSFECGDLRAASASRASPLVLQRSRTHLSAEIIHVMSSTADTEGFNGAALI